MSPSGCHQLLCLSKLVWCVRTLEWVRSSIASVLLPLYTFWTLKMLPCAMQEVSMGIWYALNHSRSIVPLRAFRSIFMCTSHPDCLCIQTLMQNVVKSRRERMACFNIDFKVFSSWHRIGLVTTLAIFLCKSLFVLLNRNRRSYFCSHHCEWFSASDSYIVCCLTLWKA